LDLINKNLNKVSKLSSGKKKGRKMMEPRDRHLEAVSRQV
jgi:hypothetical protein